MAVVVDRTKQNLLRTTYKTLIAENVLVGNWRAKHPDTNGKLANLQSALKSPNTRTSSVAARADATSPSMCSSTSTSSGSAWNTMATNDETLLLMLDTPPPPPLLLVVVVDAPAVVHLTACGDREGNARSDALTESPSSPLVMLAQSRVHSTVTAAVRYNHAYLQSRAFVNTRTSVKANIACRQVRRTSARDAPTRRSCWRHVLQSHKTAEWVPRKHAYITSLFRPMAYGVARTTRGARRRRGSVGN
jgi:hypothetical protein